MPLDGVQAENLAYWYLRLNGYFTIKDFVVHPDYGSGQQTDIDLFGVRFPYRSELLANEMVDDRKIIIDNKIQVVVAEVKAGKCRINKSWLQPEYNNAQRFLKAIGILTVTEIEKAAMKIYENGMYENDKVLIELLAFGNQKNSELSLRFRNLRQLYWQEILTFIHGRFKKYDFQKRAHPQWDKFGRGLWYNYSVSKDVQAFINKYLDR